MFFLLFRDRCPSLYSFNSFRDFCGSESKIYSEFLIRSNKNISSCSYYSIHLDPKTSFLLAVSLFLENNSLKKIVPQISRSIYIGKAVRRRFHYYYVITGCQLFGFLARRDNQNKRTFNTRLVPQSHSGARCIRTIRSRATRFLRSAKN